MKKSGHPPIKVALFGMDPRSYKTMELYLKGPCKGIAEVVTETESEIDIIDADFATAGDLLENRRQQAQQRPIVLMSLQALNVANTHFLQKPVNAEQLMEVLTRLSQGKHKLTTNTKPPKPVLEKKSPPASDIDKTLSTQESTAANNKRSSILNNEGGYTAFLGTLSDIDFNDPQQLLQASFDPKLHLLSYVQSAYKIAFHKGMAHQLNSIWKPVLIFPEKRQIWLDADDKQLRAFAGMEQGKMFAGNISLIPLDLATCLQDKPPDKFQDMDAFIWKLALWTSKGRFTHGINLDFPVYLKHWPNFTRLLLIPDAMRMAALLVKQPCVPLQIARILQVKPQYVFAFITACHSLGLLEQSQRRIDSTLLPTAAKPDKKQSFLSKILHKLRGN